MASVETRRPWIPAALAGALAVVALLVVPFSYMRTTGHTVALTLGGAGLDQGRVRDLALQFKQALHADGVAVQVDDQNGALAYTLTSTVPGRSEAGVAAAAHALSAELGRLGYTASAKVTPVRERVMGSVYAYARDQVIRVEVDGKSAAQIEADIRQQLAAAGITGAQVSVTKEEGTDHGKLELKVEAQKVSTPGHEATEDQGPTPQIVLTKGGVPAVGKGFSVRAEKRKSADGVTLSLEVHQDSKSATIEIPHVDTLSDAAIAAQVEARLKAAGIEGTVQVDGGHVTIQGTR